MKRVAVIMAGGLGVRIWPRSTEKTPKQFVHVAGEGTMIQNTYNRLRKLFDINDIYIITYESLKELLFDQLPELPQENAILEPFARNTAPCLALALTRLTQKYGKDTLLAAFPSDHEISNVPEFINSIETACDAASNLGGIVTIGIAPTRPEPSYGYVQVKDESDGLGKYYEKGVRVSTTFAEKLKRQKLMKELEEKRLKELNEQQQQQQPQNDDDGAQLQQQEHEQHYHQQQENNNIPQQQQEEASISYDPSQNNNSMLFDDDNNNNNNNGGDDDLDLEIEP